MLLLLRAAEPRAVQSARSQVNNGDYSGVAASPAPVAAALLQQLFSAFDGESLSAGGLQQVLEAHQAWAEGQLRPEPQTMQQQLQQRLAELRRQQQAAAASKQQQQQQQQRQGADGESRAGALQRRKRCLHPPGRLLHLHMLAAPAPVH
jgi:hypothetical protein